jgi:hypothetical protein
MFKFVESLQIPVTWLREIKKHNVAVLLADILSSYLNAREGQGRSAELMDGDELVLQYKPLASRLGLSDRSVSRGIDELVKLKALRRCRKDRLVNGKLTRNVVGVVPDLDIIANLSGVALGDIVSAQEAAPAQLPTGSRTPPPTDRPDGAHVPLTDFQMSLAAAYVDYFEQFVDALYRVTPSQRVIDEQAVAGVTISKARGAGRKYIEWARQYLQALKSQAEEDHGEARAAAFDRAGYVKDRFTIESFVAWAETNEPLPSGSARRSFE